ncbi:MAG: hypothetical protein F6K24_29685 [Okeania sp. SIO2D1]|nr:hypothetical protein [Okeania sp. SIO2D1]
MLFFLNPITSLVGSLSQEKALTKAYLGLSKAVAKQPITNSIGEFRFYYSRFLGYIIHNLESTITEIENQAIVQMESETTIPEFAPVYAPVEIDVNAPREVDIENPTDIGVINC